MPRKKAVKQVKKEKPSLFSKVRLNESYTSLILGVLVVALLGIIGFSLVKSSRTKQQTSSTQTMAPSQVQKENKANVNNATQIQEKYTVVSGDDLWSISEKVYKSGYNWVDIAKANNLGDPGTIFAGTKLIIPKVEPIVVGEDQAPPTVQSITGKSYTVVRGDFLWDIAVRAYGDGYKWVDIAKANNLTDPNLIFSDNVLTIPR